MQRGPGCQWFKLSKQANTVSRSGSHALAHGYLVDAADEAVQIPQNKSEPARVKRVVTCRSSIN